MGSTLSGERPAAEERMQYEVTRWVALMIQLGKFVGWVWVWGGVVGVADTNYLYPARWGWINSSLGLDQQLTGAGSIHYCTTFSISWCYALATGVIPEPAVIRCGALSELSEGRVRRNCLWFRKGTPSHFYLESVRIALTIPHIKYINLPKIMEWFFCCKLMIQHLIHPYFSGTIFFAISDGQTQPPPPIWNIHIFL